MAADPFARDCYKWFNNPHLDPETGDPVTANDINYWKEICSKTKVPPIRPQPGDTECKQWLQRPNYDPRTGEAITAYSLKYRRWQLSCQHQTSPLPVIQVQPIPEVGNFPIVPHPDELKIQHCPQLDAILRTICTVPLSQERYRDFAQYRDVFIRNFLKNNASCHGGFIVMKLSDMHDKAEIANIDIDLDKCIGSTLIPVNIGWRYDITFEPWYEHLSKTEPNFKPLPGHAMMLLFDMQDKTIEFFEPNGSEPTWVPTIVVVLVDYFNSKPEFAGFRFIQPWEGQYCPYSGWQYEAQDNTCANWSLLYAVLRVTCPHISRGDLVEMLRMKGQAYLNELMAHWDCYMREYLDSIGYFEAKRRLDEVGKKMELDTISKKSPFIPLRKLHNKATEHMRNDEFSEVIKLADRFDELYNQTLTSLHRENHPLREVLPKQATETKIPLTTSDISQLAPFVGFGNIVFPTTEQTPTSETPSSSAFNNHNPFSFGRSDGVNLPPSQTSLNSVFGGTNESNPQPSSAFGNYPPFSFGNSQPVADTSSGPAFGNYPPLFFGRSDWLNPSPSQTLPSSAFGNNPPFFFGGLNEPNPPPSQTPSSFAFGNNPSFSFGGLNEPNPQPSQISPSSAFGNYFSSSNWFLIPK